MYKYLYIAVGLFLFIIATSWLKALVNNNWILWGMALPWIILLYVIVGVSFYNAWKEWNS